MKRTAIVDFTYRYPRPSFLERVAGVAELRQTTRTRDEHPQLCDGRGHPQPLAAALATLRGGSKAAERAHRIVYLADTGDGSQVAAALTGARTARLARAERWRSLSC